MEKWGGATVEVKRTTGETKEAFFSDGTKGLRLHTSYLFIYSFNHYNRFLAATDALVKERRKVDSELVCSSPPFS